MKKRIVYMILNEEDTVHLEVISSENQINKLISLLEHNYKFKYFSITPKKDNE